MSLDVSHPVISGVGEHFVGCIEHVVIWVFLKWDDLESFMARQKVDS